MLLSDFSMNFFLISDLNSLEFKILETEKKGADVFFNFNINIWSFSSFEITKPTQNLYGYLLLKFFYLKKKIQEYP